MIKNPLIEIKNLSYKYQAQPALENITFDVFEGEKVVLLGANGSGKSTLLKILDALIFPTSGIFKAFGVDINQKYLSDEKIEYKFRQKVGYVFQDSDVQLFSPTVWDEVTFAPLQLGVSEAKVKQKARKALEIMGITCLIDRIPHQLSGGEKKKVAIASVLSYSPKVWLFDEPTTGLDPRSQSRLIDFINEIHRERNTIITATHDLSLLHEICDRVIMLSEDHQVVADDRPEEILGNLKLLQKHNLIHEHRHSHENKEHKHIHVHNIHHKHFNK